MKYNILHTAILLIFYNGTFAFQIPQWEWIRSPEGPAISRCVTTNSQGDIFIGGTFYNNLVFDSTITLTNVVFEDMFIAKYDKAGKVCWATKAEGNYGDETQCLISGNSGFVYAAGEFFSNEITFGSKTLINKYITPYFNDAKKDIFLVKYSKNGQSVWAASGGGISMEFVRDISIDQNENTTIVGTFWSTSVSFGPYILNNTGNIDVFIAQYDSSGHLLWAKNPTGNNEENAYSVAADEFGNVYVAGSFRSDSIKFDEITLYCSNELFDTYIVKYDQFGNAIWAENAVGNDWDEAKSITLDESGNIYLTGHFNSDSLRFGSVVIPKSSTNNIDMFLVKYNSEHKVVWAKNSGGNSWSWVYPSDITIDIFDNIWVIGDFIGDSLQFDQISIANKGSYDIYTVKYDENGNILWADVTGGDGMDWGQGITSDYAGNTLHTGFFESYNMAFEDTILNNPTNQNKIYLAKRVTQPTSTIKARQELDDYMFNIFNYPNPFNPSTTISFTIRDISEVEIIIFDALGKKVKSFFREQISKGLHKEEWNGTNQMGLPVSSGVYFSTFRARTLNNRKEIFTKTTKLLLIR